MGEVTVFNLLDDGILLLLTLADIPAGSHVGKDMLPLHMFEGRINHDELRGVFFLRLAEVKGRFLGRGGSRGCMQIKLQVVFIELVNVQLILWSIGLYKHPLGKHPAFLRACGSDGCAKIWQLGMFTFSKALNAFVMSAFMSFSALPWLSAQ